MEKTTKHLKIVLNEMLHSMTRQTMAHRSRLVLLDEAAAGPDDCAKRHMTLERLPFSPRWKSRRTWGEEVCHPRSVSGKCKIPSLRGPPEMDRRANRVAPSRL